MLTYAEIAAILCDEVKAARLNRDSIKSDDAKHAARERLARAVKRLSDFILRHIVPPELSGNAMPCEQNGKFKEASA